MRFCPVLLLLPAVLLHFGCQVLAPRVTQVLESEALKLPEDPFDINHETEQVAEGLNGLQLSSSSGHNVGVEAGGSHRAYSGLGWQQGPWSPIERASSQRQGYLGGVDHNYQDFGYQHDPYAQHDGYEGYQHGGYEGYQYGGYEGYPPGTFGYVSSNAGSEANEHGRGYKVSRHYTFPNEHDPRQGFGFGSGSFANHPDLVSYQAGPYGRQTAGGQHATASANAFDGRGKQPVEAYQDRASYGGQSYSLQSHDPSALAPQSSIRVTPRLREVGSLSEGLTPTQLKIMSSWIHSELLKKKLPVQQIGEALSRIRHYIYTTDDFGTKDSSALQSFLGHQLVAKHVALWAELHRELSKKGNVPSLYTLADPLALANQVIRHTPLPSDAKRDYYPWKNVYHSAVAVQASYRLRARIVENLASKTPLDPIRENFTNEPHLSNSLPDMGNHAKAASLAVQFVYRLEESQKGYNLFLPDEHRILKDFAHKVGLQKKGRGST